MQMVNPKQRVTDLSLTLGTRNGVQAAWLQRNAELICGQKRADHYSESSTAIRTASAYRHGSVVVEEARGVGAPHVQRGGQRGAARCVGQCKCHTLARRGRRGFQYNGLPSNK
jgi:hypothetical protein